MREAPANTRACGVVVLVVAGHSRQLGTRRQSVNQCHPVRMERLLCGTAAGYLFIEYELFLVSFIHATSSP